MHSSTALYSVSEIRAIEQAAISALPAGTLMQRAGQAAAQAAKSLITAPASDTSVLVLAGPGNNGGDALEAARLLADAGMRVTVLLFADPAHQPDDAQEALARARSSAARFVDPVAEPISHSGNWDLVIDGLFGIGLARAISGELHRLVEMINTLVCPVLALDVPSGLNADTGTIVGSDGIAIRATHTITFIADKPGLHTCEGRDHAGEVQVASLDIEAGHFLPADMHLNSLDAFRDSLQPRRHNSHKGSYGDVVIIGGAHGMAGAPILAGRAAAMCGAGRVFCAFVGEPPTYDSTHPELMCRVARDMDFLSSTLVAGPGLGTSRDARDILSKTLHAIRPLVLDADALNLIAAEPALRQILEQRKKTTVLTPHPLEAARLLGTSAKEVQVDRIAAARKLAHRFNAIVVLKGSGSIIARPDDALMINTTGNPSLATAGTGDVLAGICGALLAQSIPAWDAALAAVWIHGSAADALVSQGIGPIGMMAGELLPSARTILNQVAQARVAGSSG